MFCLAFLYVYLHFYYFIMYIFSLVFFGTVGYNDVSIEKHCKTTEEM